MHSESTSSVKTNSNIILLNMSQHFHQKHTPPLSILHKLQIYIDIDISSL